MKNLKILKNQYKFYVTQLTPSSPTFTWYKIFKKVIFDDTVTFSNKLSVNCLNFNFVTLMVWATEAIFRGAAKCQNFGVIFAKFFAYTS